MKDIVRVSKEQQNPNLFVREYIKYGKFSIFSLGKRFGGWHNIKIMAGLESEKHNASTEEYMLNLLKLYTCYEKLPRTTNLLKPFSKYSYSEYVNKFGSWKNTLIKFTEYLNSI